ncbi:hypothetical protein PsorP6_003413 [Peronosclerospora sorghi]|uniref:Uncharacterized protein n=1 Tax=Peronosclerospora sorghi TaxID=230839 RepID=A0ACC0VS21_9STRA|nr:hypothetical protein PsorP6_003413 [Peronosclerospora sorghi]
MFTDPRGQDLQELGLDDVAVSVVFVRVKQDAEALDVGHLRGRRGIGRSQVLNLFKRWYPELRSTAGVVSTCKTRYRRQNLTCSSTTKRTIWNKSQHGSPLSFTHARGSFVLLAWIVPNEIT